MLSSTCTCAAWRNCCVYDRSCHHVGRDGASTTYSTTTADAAITAEAGATDSATSVATNSAIGAVVAHMIEASAADSETTTQCTPPLTLARRTQLKPGATQYMTGAVAVFSSTDLASAGEMYLSTGADACVSWCDELPPLVQTMRPLAPESQDRSTDQPNNHLRHVHHSLVHAGADGGVPQRAWNA